MTGDRPTAGGDRLHAALFASFPDPLLAYSHGDDPRGDADDAGSTGASPAVRAVNPAFESTFDVGADDVVGSPLGEVELPGTVGRAHDAGERPVDVGDLAPGAGGDDPTAEGSDEAGGDVAPAVPPSATTLRSLLDGASPSTGAALRFHHDADGETRHFHVRSIPAEPADGGYLLFTDVTELEERRRDLGRAAERLERTVSVADHDLRNPLEVAAIRLDAARDSGESVHFEKVAGALDRIEHIVRDVLAVGGGRVDPTDAVALETVVEAAWDTVDTADAGLRTPGELPTVRGDADRLQQLFENLFRNAVEHGTTDTRLRGPGDTVADRSDERSVAGTCSDDTAHGRPAVTITVEPIPDGFAVADDGPGVPEDVRERVFEAGSSTTPGNSGLGLSIVRRIVREHGWRVSLAPPRGSGAHADGARFEFTGVTPAGSGDSGDGADRGARPN